MANCAVLADAIGYPCSTESPPKRLRKTAEQAPPTGAAADAAVAPQGKGTGAAAVRIELSDDDASNDAPRRRAWTKSFEDLPDAQEGSPEMTSRPLHQQSSVCSEDEYALIASQDSVMSCDDPALMQSLADSLKPITMH